MTLVLIVFFVVVFFLVFFLIRKRQPPDDVHVVVSKFMEDTSWITQLRGDVFKTITVYDKSGSSTNKHEDKRVSVVPLENVGRETDTYLNYIYDNYYDLPEHIVFTQADPFPHSPDFLNIMNNELPKLIGSEKFVPLTIRYIPTRPPDDVIRKYTKENSFYCMYTTQCQNNKNIEWDEFEFNPINENYKNVNNLKYLDNPFYHFAQEAGLHDFPSNATTLKFFYSAIFYVHSDLIKRHPREHYKKWIELNKKDLSYGYMFEKMWYYIFTGSLE